MIERIQLLMKIYQISAADLADKLGTERSGISHFLSGRNKPSLSFITKMLEKFPEVSPDWLIMGGGAMLRTEGTAANQATNVPITVIPLTDTPLLNAPIAEIPVIQTPVIDPVPIEKEQSLKDFNFTIPPGVNDEEPAKYNSSPQPKQQTTDQTDRQPKTDLKAETEAEIERIVIFYNDHSFTEYKKR